jgi:hypothetical protein
MYVKDRVMPQPMQSIPVRFFHMQSGGISQPKSVMTLSDGVRMVEATMMVVATINMMPSD